jgi:ParB/RepB/Spo0J family partition protein
LKFLPVSEIRPDPRNREVFAPLSQEELDYLAASIKDHGLINPITITPDNLIIAGEQRYRAAVQLELSEVPVIIRTPKDDLEIEELRLAENLARRNLPPYQMARAVERTAQIKIQRLAEVHEKPASQRQVNQQLAAELKRPVSTIEDTRALARLIPELGELLDTQNLSREVAMQIAQLDEIDQRGVLRVFSGALLKEIDSQSMQALKKELQESRKATEEWRRLAQKRDSTIEDTAKKIASVQVTNAKREAEESKRKAKETVDRIKQEFDEYKTKIKTHLDEERRSPIYRFLKSSIPILQLNPEEAADDIWIPVPAVAEEIAKNAIALAPWLQVFGKRLHARIREARGTSLKEVR